METDFSLPLATQNLRFVLKRLVGQEQKTKVLQQMWGRFDGRDWKSEWRDVPLEQE